MDWDGDGVVDPGAVLTDFTGISAPFEYPEGLDLEIRTDQLTIEESVEKLLDFILPKIKY